MLKTKNLLIYTTLMLVLLLCIASIVSVLTIGQSNFASTSRNVQHTPNSIQHNSLQSPTPREISVSFSKNLSFNYTVDIDKSLKLEVVAAASPSNAILTYTWHTGIEGTVIANETKSSFEFVPTRTGSYTFYVRVYATSFDGTEKAFKISNFANVKVVDNTVLTLQIKENFQPSYQLQSNDPLTLSIQAQASIAATLSYQWYKTTNSSTNGTSISGATSQSYSVPTNTEGIYQYYVVVKAVSSFNSSKTTTATSIVTTVTVVDPLLEVSISQNLSPSYETKPNTTLNLSIQAQASIAATLSYQWYSTTNSSTNGSAISGATSQSYVVPTNTEGTYQYYVVVKAVSSINSSKTTTATSIVTTVTVVDNTILEINISQDLLPSYNVLPNTNITLGIQAQANISNATLSYQWYSTTNSSTNGSAISGATESSYSVPTTTEGIYQYYVVVKAVSSTNSSKTATATSVITTFTVAYTNILEVFIYQDLHPSYNVIPNTNITLDIQAQTNIAATLSYQWYSTTNSSTNGSAISGATESSYSVPTTTEGTYQYYVIVNAASATSSNKTASVTSSITTVTVAYTDILEVSISQNLPGSMQARLNTPLTLDIQAQANILDATLSYQWYSTTNSSTDNATAIPQATESSYSVPTNAESTYQYYVVVNATSATSSNKTALVTSSIATIKVIDYAIIDIYISTNNLSSYNVQLDTPLTLDIQARVNIAASVSYQWYSTTDTSTDNGTPILGATEPSYNVPTDTEGVYQYYVIVNATSTANPNKTLTVTSLSTTVSIGNYGTGGGTDGGDVDTLPPNESDNSILPLILIIGGIAAVLVIVAIIFVTKSKGSASNSGGSGKHMYHQDRKRRK